MKKKRNEKEFILLFDAVVLLQIDIKDARNHDEIEINVVAFKKDDHDFRDEIIAKDNDYVIANIVKHFVVIINKSLIALLKETIKHFHEHVKLSKDDDFLVRLIF